MNKPLDSFRYSIDDKGCWIWAGYCDKNGYARIYDREGGQIVWAHRYSYAFHKGALTPGMEIDHMCEVTNCVNPDHLQQLTKSEHVRITMQRLGKDQLHLAAAHLRRLGCTYREIAEALQYGNKESASSAVLSAIRKGLVDADEIPTAKRINEVERQEIVELVTIGVPQTVVAECYGLHSSQVSRISRGISSGHPQRRDVA